MTPKRLLAAIAAAIFSTTLLNFGAVSVTKNMLDLPALQVGADYAKIGEDALKKYPKLSPIEARAKYSNDLLKEKLSSAADPHERAVTAASAFMGFWLVQGRARAEYCEVAGVDLSAFRHDFEEQNRGLHEIAAGVLAREKYGEVKIWKTAKVTMLQQIQYEMLYIKGGLPTTTTDACNYVLSKRADVRALMHFRYASPAGYQALLDARSEARS